MQTFYPVTIDLKPAMSFDTQILLRPSKGLSRRAESVRAALLRISVALLVRIRESEIALIVLAGFIGFAVGGGVAVMNGAVMWLHYIIFGVPLSQHLSAGDIPLTPVGFIAPAFGGLLVGLLTLISRYFRSRDTVDAIEANALYGGRMSMVDSLSLGLMTVISVGFGGSAGLEAAYTQVGSGFASKLGQNIRLRRQDMRLIVGCGAAAAIAAAFNSPLAGAFYAFELVIGSYSLQALAPIACASLTGNLAMQATGQSHTIFTIPPGMIPTQHDYVLFIGLGLGAAVVSIISMRLVTVVEATLRRNKVASWLRPALGGFGVGLVALFWPQVLGSGHGAVSTHLDGGYTLELLVGLLFAKIVASALTVGSGMRGGLFSSSLFLGAIYGGVAARFLTILFPELSIDIVAYSLVGMAAVAGGIVGAPVTMILLVLETTGNFSLTIGVMAGVIASTATVRQTFGYSFATWRFHVRGLRIRSAADVGWISELTVGRLMRRDFHLAAADATVAALRKKYPLGGPKFLFVVDDGGRYIGLVDVIDVHSSTYDDDTETKAADLIREEPVSLHPDQNIHAAILKFMKTTSEVLPVVERQPPGRILGYVTEKYALKRYSQELEKQRSEEANGGVFGPEGA